jgi:purine-binding chemotaxis protein CheW
MKAATDPSLLVSIGGRRFALPLGAVREVVDSRPFARVPGATDAVCGVINLRGTVVTVFDLGVLLGNPPAALDPLHRLVLVEHRGRPVGLAVSDVLRIRGDADAEAATPVHPESLLRPLLP